MTDTSDRAEPVPEDHKELLRVLVGHWEGTYRTWFEPTKVADESAVRGEFTQVLDGYFLRHSYEGTMLGKPRSGEELLAFNKVAGVFELTWIDDFHMNCAILFSLGKPTLRGFDIRGSYDVGAGQPSWGWRTVYEMRDNDTLSITAYNVEPDESETLAMETVYHRVKN
jgi:hypothetical protein